MPADKKYSNCYIRQRPQQTWQFQGEQFDPAYWQQQPGYRPTDGGRGGSCLIEVDGQRAVLRRYLRGGAVSRVLTDRYLWLGRGLSRPWREWEILLRAREAGLPVPEPIGACVCRSFIWYRAALITAFLEDTEMLTQRLRREKLAADSWHRLGLLIKRMHVAGICHADLNSDNILIDSQDRFYLIDFDRARVVKQLDDWQWQPLYRLQRSIDKRHRQQALNCDEDDWQALMDGYQS